MRRLVEVVGQQVQLGYRGDGIPGEQHGSEDRLLGLEVVRRDPTPPTPGPGTNLIDRLGHHRSPSRAEPVRD